MHPLWMTAEEWFKSDYCKEYGGEGRVLFEPNSNQNYDSELFPIYPVAELMFRVTNGWCYQPYYCKDSDTYWVYCKVVDYSSHINLKSKDEIDSQQMRCEKYCKYAWNEEELNEVGFDYIIETSEGVKCSRSNLTHVQLMKLIEDPKRYKKWKKKIDELKERLDSNHKSAWSRAIPHVEKPVKIFVEGSDDSSYTEVLSTLEEAMNKIDKWKLNPPSNVNNWPEAVFTN